MKNWPLCAQVGALHGMIIGFAFGVLQTCCQQLRANELVSMLLLFTALAVLVSLFVLVVVRKYSVGSVLWPTVLNALLVGFVVILVLWAIGPQPWGPLLGVALGFLLGLLVGALLCRVCGDRVVGRPLARG